MNVVIGRTMQFVSLVVALVVMAAPASAQDRLIQEEKDAVTNATVRLYRTSRGPRIDVEASTIRMRKQMIGDKVITSLMGGGQSLVIEFDGRTFSVAGSTGRASTTRDDQAGFERVRQLVVKSPLTRRATSLIARMGFGPKSPIQPMLLTTRMFLLALSADQSGVHELSEWIRETRTRLAVVKATYDDRTPSECWREYVKEAIEAWTEYEACMKEAKWWDLLSQAGCSLVYDMRALGAFSWWLDCVKLSPIIRG